MSLRIWKEPDRTTFEMEGTERRYEQGTVSGSHEVTAEIGRFSGSRTECYRDTGECSFTADASQIGKDQIKLGYFIDIDGATYRVESIDWKITDEGYICEFGGRGIESFLDDTPYERMTAPHYTKDYNAIVGSGEKTITYKTLAWTMCEFFGETHYDGKIYKKDIEDYNGVTITSKGAMIARKLPCTLTGFAREERAEIVEALDDPSASFNAGSAFEDVNDFGSIVRTMCNYLNCGYRMRIEWCANARQEKTVVFTYYNKPSEPSATFEVGKMRGITDFEYSISSRNAVNQVLYYGSTGDDSSLMGGGAFGDASGLDVDPFEAGPGQTSGHLDVTASLIRKGRARSYYDMASLGAAKAVNIGDYPTGDVGLKDWLKSKVNANDIVPIEESVSFSYDNSGTVKYGTDFVLGSTVKIVEDTVIGVSATQKLTKVTTKYEQGAAKTYLFEFGSQRVTAQDKIVKRFGNVDRRGYYRNIAKS